MTTSILHMFSPKRRARALSAVAALCAVLLVGACDTEGTPLEGMFGDAPLPPKCPTVKILREAIRVTQFKDDVGRDLTDVTGEARIADFSARCLYSVDDETGKGEVGVELTVAMEVARGPANDAGIADFPYFVSITDKQKNILTKRVVPFHVQFKKNAFQLALIDQPLLLRIPIKPPTKGDAFLIYIGLQLTPEQLDYNAKNSPALLGG